MIYKKVKSMMVDRDIHKIPRDFYKLIYSELGRIDDGKEINDEKCLSVIRKMRAGVLECMKHLSERDSRYEENDMQLALLEDLLPQFATDKQMKDATSFIMAGGRFVKPMMAMKYIKEFLVSKELEINGAELAKIVGSYEKWSKNE